MIEAVILALVDSAIGDAADRDTQPEGPWPVGAPELAGLSSVWDFDPDIIQDSDYPALTLDYVGSPGHTQRTPGGLDVPFDLAATLYTAAPEPGVAKRELRNLVYAGNGVGLMAWLDKIGAAYIKAFDRIYKAEIGRVRTGISNRGGTFSAAASVTLTVKSRGR